MPDFDKVVVVTRKTALEELVERFNTRDQARFYIEHLGASFADYQASHDTYHAAVKRVRAALPDGVRSQFIERAFLPMFLFGERDLAVTLGPDGLVVNTAKYLNGQPLLALNPDPQRIDGVLVPFIADKSIALLARAVRGKFSLKRISMAKAELNNGQVLLGLNDLFIGQRTHISARYRLKFRKKSEDQSSSGIIVSTGAGSTGWFRSILTGAAGIIEKFSKADAVRAARDQYRFDWESEQLYFSVREPFISKTSAATLVFGQLERRDRLEITSQMPQNGVIFSDGIETDYLEFNSGTLARVGLADKKLNLISSISA